MWRNLISAVILTAITVGVSWAVPVLPPDGWRYAIPIAQDPASMQIEPDVASRGDSVFTAWIDTRTSPYKVYFRRSLTKGFTWPADQVITGSDGVSRHLSIAIAPNSQWTYLLWTDGLASPYALKFARSSNRGVNWLPIQTLESNLLDEPCGSICVDGNSHVHIAYYKRMDPVNKNNHLIYGISE